MGVFRIPSATDLGATHHNEKIHSPGTAWTNPLVAKAAAEAEAMEKRREEVMSKALAEYEARMMNKLSSTATTKTTTKASTTATTTTIKADMFKDQGEVNKNVKSRSQGDSVVMLAEEGKENAGSKKTKETQGTAVQINSKGPRKQESKKEQGFNGLVSQVFLTNKVVKSYTDGKNSLQRRLRR